MRRIDHVAKGAGSVGAAVGHQAPRAKRIAAHIQHYSENPRAHAKALRQLGVPAAQVQRVHRATMPTRQARLAPLSAGEAKKLKPYTHQQALEKAAEIGLSQAGIREHNVSGLSGVSHLLDRGPVAKTLTGLGEAGLYSVPGLAIGTKNLATGTYHDINNISHGHLNRPSHGAKAAKAFVPNIRRDIKAARHGDLSGVVLDAWMGAGIFAGGVSRAGAAGRAIHAGEGAARALKRPGSEGGSLLHKPEPGTFKMRVGDQVIERPLSRNPARAEIQKARWRKQQKQIDAHRTPEHALREAKRGRPPHITGPTAEGSVGSQAVRQRRYQRSSELGAAHFEHAATKKFSGGEEAAARTIAIEGKHALTHPEEVVSRHIAKHTEWMNAPGADKVAHEDIITQLKTALPVLKKQDPKFLNGVEALRQMQNHAEEGSIARDLLNPRTAERRKAEMAVLYDSPNAKTAPSISRAAQRLARAERPSAGVERAAQRVARLEGLVHRSAAKEFNIDRLPSHLGGHGPGPNTARLTAALSVAKDDLQARVKAVDTRRARLRKEFDVAKKSTIAAPEGSFYFHAAPYDKQRTFGTGFNPRPSELGLNAKPQVGRYSPELMHRFRGQAAMHGYLPTNITEHSLQTFGRRVALHDVHDTLDMVKKMGSPVRQSWQDKAIRLDKAGMAEMKRMLKAFEQHKDLTPGEEQELMAGELERLKQHIQGEDMTQANREVTPGTNTHDQGIVWYNERLLKDMGELDPHGKAGRIVDSITNPLRFATLYARLGYIWNLAGNAGMLAPEGVRGMYEAFKAPGQKFELSPENSAWIDSTADVGKALGQTMTTGKFAKSTRAVAGWWNTVTDLAFRRAAFRLAARRLGYKTDADLTRLRTDPKLQADRNEITQRARGIMGDYSDLNPAERNVVRRAIYFYPWTKVAYKWTGHLVGEHPIETAVLAQLSREEGQHVKDVLGRLPEWARLSGIIPIGHANKAGNLLTTNLGGINTPLSTIQTGAAVGNTVKALLNLPRNPGATGLGDIATPPLAMLLGAGAPPEPGRPGGLPGQIEQLPFAAALRRAGVFGKPSKTYPARGVKPALAGLGGGPVPKLTSKTALNKAGEKEYVASLSPTDHVDYKYKTFYSQVEKATLATAAHTGKTHADAERALKWTRGRLALRRERSLARAKADANGTGKGKERYLADLSVLVAHKWVKPERAKELEKWAQTAKPDDITKSIAWLTDHYFDAGNELTATIKYLREHGDPNLTLRGLH